ncbi:MAG: tetratricopeptide repeat protein [Sphaerobacter sp.]|nr:tetratricopeptide repeat protein [Sphaerobacter sp.]
MPALPLPELLDQAQNALSEGDTGRAIAACRRILQQYPDCVAAHRLMGEAHLAQRERAEAERAFAAALLRDPQCVAAYVGLGRIAEEHQDVQAALAYYQAAWEIAPAQGELRECVMRLARETYGPDGRLQLTRAGLASLHYQAGRWGRAVAECAAVLAEYPSRVDVRLRLAQALWRRGEWDRAAAACRAVLDQTAGPGALGALLLLADIERRRGNQSAAAALRDRARALDPTGARAAELLASADGLDFFIPAEPLLVDEVAAPVVETALPRIGPAPDFLMVEEHADAPPPPPDLMVEARAAAPSPPPAPVDLALPTDQEVEAARPEEISTAGYTGLLRSLEDSGLEPFAAEDFDAAADVAPPWVTDGQDVDATPPAPAAAELDVAEPDVAAPPRDEDLAALFAIPSDREIEAARPDEPQLAGFTTILQSLEERGLAPFHLAGTPDEPAAPPEPAAGTAESVSSDWDAIDEEIRDAIPGETPRGYTDELRSLAAAGVEPFTFDDEEIPFFQRTRPDVSPVDTDAPAAAPPEMDDLDALAAWVPVPETADESVASTAEAAAVPLAEADLAILAEDETAAEPDASAERALDAGAVSGAIERLGMDPELVERARTAKAALIAAGQVAGDRSLAPAAEAPDAGPTATAPAAPVGADLAALAAAVRQQPTDVAARFALAEALVDAGQAGAALEQYQWLYRHPADDAERLIHGLTRITAADPEAAIAAHRLLGAIYRKRGEVHLASRHYSLAVSRARRDRRG